MGGNRLIDGGVRTDDQSFGIVGGEVVTAMLGVGVIPVEGTPPGSAAWSRSGRSPVVFSKRASAARDHCGVIRRRKARESAALASRQGMAEPIVPGRWIGSRIETHFLRRWVSQFRRAERSGGMDQGCDHRRCAQSAQHLVRRDRGDPRLLRSCCSYPAAWPKRGLIAASIVQAAEPIEDIVALEVSGS